jgi:peptide/nickel transport system substrate-binding protein
VRQKPRALPAAWARSALGVAVAALLLGTAVQAQTLRIGVEGDAGTMDPHAQIIQTAVTLQSMVYDTLVGRDRQMQLAPALATRWETADSRTWRFHLRPDVRFHDGARFTATDVEFSLRRAQSPTSQFQQFVATIRDIHVIDPLTIELVTARADLLLPDELTYVFMMSRAWADQHDVRQPQNLGDRQETFASLHADGTGPFILRTRVPDTRTVLERNPYYWGTIESNLERVEWVPVASGPTRIAALVSGELDILLDVPPQDVAWLSGLADLKVERTDELRNISFGFDFASDQLRTASPGIGNPFRDRRVREAIYRAIDITAIQRNAMRGLATPTGQLLAPGNVGYDPALDARLPYDPAGARRLLAEAGYPRGFAFTLDCPNDRYPNDEQVCRAVTTMLAQVGLDVTLEALPRGRYFAKVVARDTTMFMLGLNAPFRDGLYGLEVVYMTPDGAEGYANSGAYSDPALDEMIRAARTEIDPARREELLRAAWRRATAAIAYVPMYHQVLAWAMRRNVDTVLRADGWLEIRWTRVN